MKIFFILAVMLLPLTYFNSNGQKAPGRADQSFASFWSRFKTAVAKTVTFNAVTLPSPERRKLNIPIYGHHQPHEIDFLSPSKNANHYLSFLF